MKNRIAAIDFGTNTARLLIADQPLEGGFKHICLEREIVRMGGGFRSGCGLSPEAVERGMACLKRFAATIHSHSVSEIRAVATSAVRDAENGARFREKVFQETGIELTVIDGTAEGLLTLKGVLAGLDRKHENILLFDIGGGSTEYTLAYAGEARFVSSLPLGVVRLTEGKGSVEAMDVKIRKELSALEKTLRTSGCSIDSDTVLIGTAGTATTLAAISLKMEHYDYRKVNNLVLSQEEIRNIFDRLVKLLPEERLKIPGVEKGREDLIIAGTLVTLATMEMFAMNFMKVSDYGLLEGLVVEKSFPAAAPRTAARDKTSL